MKAYVGLGATLIALCGCAAIFEGTSQEITINTNPPGANCSLDRKGVSIGRVNPTPGAVTIKKTKDDLTIVCTKDGYQQATVLNHSDAAGATVADVIGGLLLGPIAWGVDSASGADNKYDGTVNLSMVPVVAGAASGGTTGDAKTAAPAAGTAEDSKGAVPVAKVAAPAN